MTLASNLWKQQQRYLTSFVKSLLLVALLLLTSCGGNASTVEPSTSKSINIASSDSRPKIKQVETPELIQSLAPWLSNYAPQVKIIQPNTDQVLESTTAKIALKVQDLPIYKDADWGLGPHVELLLDNQPYGEIYDLEQPIVLDNLTPGTHTLRAFAMRPWHESFKNEGSYAQVTFHILARTDENSPATAQPLLTYGSPVGRYGAEPVLLDFYLMDAPLHQVAADDPTVTDWQIRYTVNGESYTIKDWKSVYIEGLHPGQNWLQLTLVDNAGNPIEGVFNNTVRLVEYDPDLNDSLAQLVRGDLDLADIGGIVDPNYQRPAPEVITPAIAPESPDEDETVQDIQSEEETIDPPLVKEPTPAPKSETKEIPLEQESPSAEDVDVLTPEAPDATFDDFENSTTEEEKIGQSAADSDLGIETESSAVLNEAEPNDVETIQPAVASDGDTPQAAGPDSDIKAEPPAVLDEAVSDDVEPPVESDSTDTEPVVQPVAEQLEPTETLTEPPPVSDSAEPTAGTDSGEAQTSARRYLKRLYDYSDRAKR